MVNWYVWCVVLSVSLGGFIFGYDIGSLNGVKDMSGYRSTLNISSAGVNGTCDSQDDVETSAVLGLIVSLFSVGSLAGAILSGILSELAGRKPAIIGGALLSAISGALHTTALNMWMVLASRLVGGFASGVLYQAVPLYVAEISPEKLRGQMISIMNNFSLTGMLIGAVVNVGVKNLFYGWRISVGIEVMLGATLTLVMFFFPRSPRWLVKKHQDERALEILLKVYKDESRAQVQLEAIRATVSSTREPILHTLKYIFRWKILQRLLIGISLMFLGRFTGLNFIMYFSVTLFCGIGLPGFVVTIALSAISVVGVVLGSLTVDKLGRKPLMLIGLCVMFVTHIASATIILAFDLEDLDGSISVSQTVAGYCVLVLLCLFLATAVSAAGNIVWIVINEMFPMRGRGILTSFCSAAFWASLIAVTQVAPVLISSPLSISGTLLVFAAFSFFDFLFVLLTMPETKGYTLEGIEELFSKPWSVRTNVLFYLRCGCVFELISGRKEERYHRDDKQPQNVREPFDSKEEEVSEIDDKEVDEDQHKGSSTSITHRFKPYSIDAAATED